jgi:glycosyltransferase involved in cell wall biosynthesis
MINKKPIDKYPGGLTVLMSAYSKSVPALFTKAVRSVFEGNLIPDCFILVVDGPLDLGLERALEDVTNNFDIEVVRLPENAGLANALNYGLSFVKTEWVARADDDDFNLPNRFEAQLPYALESDTVMRYVDYDNCVG